MSYRNNKLNIAKQIRRMYALTTVGYFSIAGASWAALLALRGFSILEIGMLVCFGLSWPFNIAKSLRSRTAKGKSTLFEMMIIIGYLFGLSGKFLAGNITYVVAFYVIDILLVSTDLVLTFRNKRLDKERENV